MHKRTMGEQEEAEITSCLPTIHLVAQLDVVAPDE